MDNVHPLTARHFRYELRLRGGKIFISKFEAREVCIASQQKMLLNQYSCVRAQLKIT